MSSILPVIIWDPWSPNFFKWPTSFSASLLVTSSPDCFCSLLLHWSSSIRSAFSYFSTSLTAANVFSFVSVSSTVLPIPSLLHSVCLLLTSFSPFFGWCFKNSSSSAKTCFCTRKTQTVNRVTTRRKPLEILVISELRLCKQLPLTIRKRKFWIEREYDGNFAV